MIQIESKKAKIETLTLTLGVAGLTCAHYRRPPPRWQAPDAPVCRRTHRRCAGQARRHDVRVDLEHLRTGRSTAARSHTGERAAG